MEEAKGRLKEYKNVGKDPEECRRRRQEMTVQLRKVNQKILKLFLHFESFSISISHQSIKKKTRHWKSAT